MNKEDFLRTHCPLCGNRDEVKGKVLRDFSGAAEIMPFLSYEVKLCPKCGFVYAGDIKQAMSLTEYYALLSKYERSGLYDSSIEKERFTWEAGFLKEHLPLEISVLDIGCSSGGLLRAMQKVGFRNLSGFEPSSVNVHRIQEDYGISAYVGAMGEGFPKALQGRKFDLLVLNNVLEHVLLLHESLNWCLDLLSDHGYFYIEVPDLEQFQEKQDLYQQFSSEHVNYFTLSTLSKLMLCKGMKILASVQHHGELCSLWKREDVIQEDVIQYDLRGQKALEEYLEEAASLGHKLCEHLQQIPAGTSVYIWGAGTHTAMLYQLGGFKHLEVRGIIDANKNYQGHKMFGVPIISPESSFQPGTAIIVSSQGAQEEICKQITGLCGDSCPVIRLYD